MMKQKGNQNRRKRTYHILEICMDKIIKNLDYGESLDLPFRYTIDGVERIAEFEVRCGKEIRIFAGGEPMGIEKESADKLVNSFLTDERFEEQREELKAYEKALLIDKPAIDLKVLSHEVFPNNSIDFYFQVVGLETKNNEGLIVFNGDGYEDWHVFEIDSPYYGFQMDIATLVKEKMKMLFLMEKGE